MCKPAFVLIIILLNGASFFILILLEKMIHDVEIDTVTIINSICFVILWVMAVWSLIVIVISQPGFIPNGYRY